LELISWAMVSAIAAVAGVIYSAITFQTSSSKLKESNQIRIVQDIMNNRQMAENNIIETLNAEKFDDMIFRYTQLLNVWEWYSFLVNKKKITLPEIKNFYKEIMLKERKEIFEQFPELDDESKFTEYRKLCKELEGESN
jgi:hypothetical protein